MSMRANRWADVHTVQDFDAMVPALNGVEFDSKSLGARLSQQPPTIQQMGEARALVRKFTEYEDDYHDLIAFAGASLRGTMRDDTFLFAREAYENTSYAIQSLETVLSRWPIQPLIDGAANALFETKKKNNLLRLPDSLLRGMAMTQAHAIAYGYEEAPDNIDLTPSKTSSADAQRAPSARLWPTAPLSAG
ncbi:MAG: hypothetical protein AAFQ82_04420 [Myxococcota bacterium]